MTTVAMTTIVSIVKDQKLQLPHRVGECGRGRWLRIRGQQGWRGGRPEQAGLGRRGGENERGKILTSQFSLTLIRGFWGEAASVISQTCLHQTPFLHDELIAQLP